MATMTVTKFNTPEGAEQMLSTIQQLDKQRLITLLDGAMVTWPEGKRKPKIRQLHNMTSAGALSGAFWGMLFGMIFLVPLFGLAIGAAMGAVSGSFRDFGIDDEFVKKLRDEVKEGTSALFLLTQDAVQDRVVSELKQFDFEILSTNLSHDEEARLRAAFAEEE